MTADNPFVDKNFLIRLIKIYKFKNLEYTAAHDNIKNYHMGYKLKFLKLNIREIKQTKYLLKNT